MIKINLINQNPREEQIYHHAPPVEILRHQSEVWGPPGDQTVRRIKKNNERNPWYFFDRTGLAVARIEPEVWAKAIAGV